MVEKLRRQTQERLDAGFTGLDSTAFLRDRDSVLVGVGELDSSVISEISVPVLFVVKKNKTVLEKLEQWLKRFNADPADGKIRLPLLLIDDEADNASVNTAKPEDSPTAINASIRKLLSLFSRSDYVGFTATPYANIFINPDSTDEMLGDELFPRNFIYALDAPTNYIGARTVFPEDGIHHYMLKNNDDCEFYIPEKHPIHFEPSEPPPSLKEAIASFFLANAVRDLRGQETAHRSMLINVSRFIAVQNCLCSLVDGYVRDLQRVIAHYCATGEQALSHEEIRFLKKVYDEDFAALPDHVLNGEKRFSWEEIQRALPAATASIVVRAVNGGNASKNLNYDECEEDGLRMIAIGGLSLSRGLTLEGLCTSYFHRNSRMYDTLMQMGRWFGYRDHYADVCRIWLSESSQDWYTYISDASDELRREVKKMDDCGLTPEQFGLGVRNDRNALLVTAVNKMRYAENIRLAVSLNGSVVETPYLYMDAGPNEENYRLVTDWIRSLLQDGYSYAKERSLALRQPQIIGVSLARIRELLGGYRSHYLNMDFRPEDLPALLRAYDDDTVSEWDVLISTGSGENILFCEKEIRPVVRSFNLKSEQNAIQISGNGARLGSPNSGRGGLDRKTKDRIEERIRHLRPETDPADKALSEEDYFRSGIQRRPLLTIYPLQLKTTSRDREGRLVTDPLKQELVGHFNHVLIGLGIGIPLIDGRKKKTCHYKVNLVKWRERLDVDGDGYLDATGVTEIR